MTPRCQSLAASAGFLAAFSFPIAAQVAAPSVYNVPSVAVRSIQWAACTRADVEEGFITLLADRLRCGTVIVPRDHHRPDDGNIRLQVLRIAAADPARRQGALFVNPGGPGGDARSFAVTLSAIWMHAKPDDPVHGEKRRMADAFDLIAVVPRGMPGSTPLQCVGEFPTVRTILFDRSVRNAALWDLLQRRVADACRADPLYPYINTEQTVYDLDFVRRALGETTFNYLGVSYGTWLGAWYGATYPDKVGRLLLDSTMDFTSSMEENYRLTAQAEQERFDRLVTMPAIAAPATYGLGAEAAVVRGLLATLPYRVYQAWTGEYRSPESLKAAIAMGEWLRAEPDIAHDVMASRITATTFHATPDIDRGIRREARRILKPLHDDGIHPAEPAAAPAVHDRHRGLQRYAWYARRGRVAADHCALRGGLPGRAQQ